MSSSTATLTVDHWQFLLQKTMQALQRAQEAVQGQFGFWGLVNGLWRCARDLKDLNAYLNVVSESPNGVMKQEVIESQIASLHTLLKSIDDLMEVGKRKGLTNRTVTGASLGLISVRGEYIADYLDALEMSIDPQVIAAIHEGRSQIERGDVEVMERLF